MANNKVLDPDHGPRATGHGPWATGEISEALSQHKPLLGRLKLFLRRQDGKRRGKATAVMPRGILAGAALATALSMEGRRKRD